jgi:hypothetical protein
MRIPAILILFLVILNGVYLFQTDLESKTTQVNRCPAQSQVDRPVMGHLETVKLGVEQPLYFEAKIDSGAEVSSIHAENIHAFTKVMREGKEKKEILYVQFTTIDDKNQSHELTHLVSRIDQVKSSLGISTRYFFKDTVFINNQPMEIEINLADRSNLSRKFLIGRNILNQGYLIDTSRSYVLTESIKTSDD